MNIYQPPSYDIMVENWKNSGEMMLIKYVRESNVLRVHKSAIS